MRVGRLTFVSILATLGLTGANAVLSAELLSDLNDDPVPQNSHPFPFTPFGNLAVFTADDRRTGREPWVTDGTEAGTRLLADVRPGPGSSTPQQYTVVGNQLFFMADDGTNFGELWATDGTPTGTRIVANITPNNLENNAQQPKLFGPLTTFNGAVYFLHRDTLQNVALWRSDGTISGTVRIVELPASPFGSLGQLQIFGNRMYFPYNSNASGLELWSTDGTANGTRIVVDLRRGAGTSSPQGIIVTEVGAYFTADDGVRGYEFWFIASPGAAPVAVPDIVPGPAGIDNLNVHVDGTRLFVSGPGGVITGLYRLENGTAVQIETAPLSIGASMTSAGGLLYYIVYGASSLELWVTNGSPGNARFVYEFVSAVPDLGAQDFRLVGSHILISMSETFGFAQLYASDGTTAGTVPIDLVGLRTIESQAGGFAVGGGAAYFFASEFIEPGDPNELGEARFSLWRTTGTQAGTVRIGSGFTPGFVSSDSARLNGMQFFGINDPAVGGELFFSDGTAGNLTLLRDIADGVATLSSHPGRGVIVGGFYYFPALDASSVGRLWRTDGTSAGTVMLDLGDAGLTATSAGTPTALGNKLLYAGYREATGFELHAYDLNNSTDILLSDSAPGQESGFTGTCESRLPTIGGVALFNAFDGQRSGIYVTDGTVAGTSRLLPLGSPDEQLTICHAVPYKGQIYFFDGLDSIWSTDGSTAGTARVVRADHLLGAQYVTVSNGLIFFTASDGASPSTRQLWRTDGTAPGTFQLSSVPQEPVNITAVGTRTVFRSACTGPNSCPLYVSDGTVAGTQRLSSGAFGGPSMEQPFPVWRDRAWFHGTSLNGVSQQNGVYSTDGFSVERSVPLPTSANQQFWPVLMVADRLVGISPLTPNQFSLWSSDGTPERTRPLAEFPGGSGVPVNSPWTAVPDSIFLLGTNLVFYAADRLKGLEPWVIPDGRPSANADGYLVSSTGTSTLDVLTNDGDLESGVDPSTVEIVVAPRSGSAVANASTGTIQYTPIAGSGGQDEFSYQVRDDQGNLSNVAFVTVLVRRAEGPAPNVNPPPPPPPGGGGGRGGGGGPMDPMWLLLISVLLMLRHFGRDHSTSACA